MSTVQLSKKAKFRTKLLIFSYILIFFNLISIDVQGWDDSVSDYFYEEYENGNGIIRIYLIYKGGNNGSHTVQASISGIGNGNVDIIRLMEINVIVLRNGEIISGKNIIKDENQINGIVDVTRLEFDVFYEDNITFKGTVSAEFSVPEFPANQINIFNINKSYFAPKPSWFETTGIPLLIITVIIVSFGLSGLYIYNNKEVLRKKIEIKLEKEK
ncbi:MAG: hypothetical protein GY870_01880 [archaeon]|nr:hypothetical protein [archaeon]